MRGNDGGKLREPSLVTEVPDVVKQKIEAPFEPRYGVALSDLACKLLQQQKNTWPELGKAYADLKHLQSRTIDCGNFYVTVQYNPRRIRSTGASVDPETLQTRNCFLCHSELPPNQRAILYRGTYLLLCNPAPIFHEHFTIAHLEHIPQAIDGHVTEFLLLAEDVTSRLIVSYNGPRCGASAPGHLHFQAMTAALLPVENDITRPELRKEIWQNNGTRLLRISGIGREIWVLEGFDPISANSSAHLILSAIGQCIGPVGDPLIEPMMNIIGVKTESMWKIIFFPRRKHRPDAFYREGKERIVISPAAVEMGGILIAPLERDFERLNAAMVRDIYEEVSLDEPTALRILKTFTGG
jgi:hypothetical protein